MLNRRTVPGVLFAAVAFVLAAVLAFRLTALPAARQVQRVDAKGVLSVVFADAKGLLSQTMLMKADEYFHGGLDRRTARLRAAARAEEERDCDAGHEHGHGCDSDHDHDCASGSDSCGGTSDPAEPKLRHDIFSRIAEGIAAPEEHRHLEGGETREMLPLIWAAARADPGNDEAWSTAWYVINYYLGDRKQAHAVVDEALRVHPDSIEMRFIKGETYWVHGTGDLEAAAEWFAEAKDAAVAKCGGAVGKLSEKDLHNARLAITLLASILRDRGETDRLVKLRADAAFFGESAFSYASVTNAIRIVAERRQKGGDGK